MFNPNNNNPAQRIDMMANWSQFVSLFLLLKDASNAEILQELNHQNSAYLEKIIEQNEEIIKLLKERDGDIHL